MISPSDSQNMESSASSSTRPRELAFSRSPSSFSLTIESLRKNRRITHTMDRDRLPVPVFPPTRPNSSTKALQII